MGKRTSFALSYYEVSVRIDDPINSKILTGNYGILKLSIFLTIFSFSLSGNSQRIVDLILKSKKPCPEPLASIIGTDVVVYNLGDQVNTEFSEYNSVFTADGSIMLYTTRNDSSIGKDVYGDDGQYYEDISLANKIGRRYGNGTNLYAPSEAFPYQVNTKKHEAPVCFNYDDSIFVMYKENKLWYSQLTDTGYSDAVAFDSKINFSNIQRHASISKDGSAMYFSAEVEQKLTGRKHLDIFKSLRQEDGSWGDPIPLPETINTVYDEDSPEISFDGVTMYYSSNMPGGIGGYDVYYTKFENEKWIEPINLCVPVNSEAHDVYFKLERHGPYAYFSSNRLGGFGNLDLYKVLLNIPTFDNCVDLNDKSLAGEVMIEIDDTVGVGRMLVADGIKSRLEGEMVNHYHWSIDGFPVTEGDYFEFELKDRGVYEIKLFVNRMNEEYIDVVSKCVTKKIVAIDEDDYLKYMKRNNISPKGSAEDLLSIGEILVGEEDRGTSLLGLKNDYVNTLDNTPISILPLKNDNTDSEDQQLRLLSVTRPITGHASIIEVKDARVRYIPKTDYKGPDLFQYEATNEKGEKEMANIVVEVLTEDDYMDGHPVRNDEYTFQNSDSMYFDVFANDPGAEYGLQLKYLISALDGELSIIDSNTGILQFVPNKDFEGEGAFLYTTTDGFGLENSAMVTFTVAGLSNGHTSKLTEKDYKRTNMGEAVLLDLFANDKFRTQELHQILSITGPSNGSVKVMNREDGLVLYVPDKSFVGVDGFVYNVATDDGEVISNVATVVIETQVGEGDLLANADQFTTIAGKAVEGNLLDNDESENDDHTIYNVEAAEHGALVVLDKETGAIKYTPVEDFHGSEILAYTIIDKNGNKSKSTVQFNVGDASTASHGIVLADDRIETAIETPIVFAPLENDVHLKDRRIEILALSTPAHGTVRIDNKYESTVMYIPAAGFIGEDNIVYEVIDHNGHRAKAQIFVQVIPLFSSNNIKTDNAPKLSLKPIFFDYESSSVRTSEEAQLAQNIKLLKENPKAVIKVVSHCDSRGTNEYNIRLSTKRATATVDYLVAHGISRERIIAVVGMGETSLTTDCPDGVDCSEADHQLNRRSEFQVIGLIR